MLEEKKKAKSVEDSLGFMAWDVKGIAKELARLNVLLEALLKEKQKNADIGF